ncbi:hypothetical protein ERJ75_001533200 [Trypanosoma vivax]|nr:hypothetical protein ERJ75_001533200 [Trypanosoma vivax]
MVRSRRQAGAAHLVKIHGLGRDCALTLTKKARRAALTHKHGCTCHVCGEDFERRAPLVDSMAPHLQMKCQLSRNDRKEPGKKTRADDGVERKCSWRSKKSTARAWVRKRMLQKHRRRSYREELRGDRTHPTRCRGRAGGTGATGICVSMVPSRPREQDVDHQAPVRTTSIIKSEGSNELEQPVTVASPICSEECRYRWLLRHVLTKHPRHNESLRPQSRAKAKRKDMRTENRSQGERSGPLDRRGWERRCGETVETSPSGPLH